MADLARILIIRPSALGDVCRSVPVLVSLRSAYPTARIDWLVQDSFAGAIEAHPALDNVVLFPRRPFGKLHRPKNLIDFMKWIGSIRRTRYDMVVDAQGLLRSGFFACASRAPRRVGYRNAAELAWVFTNQSVLVPKSMHAVDRMLALMETAGAHPTDDMRLYTSAEHRAEAVELLGDRRKRMVLLAPTSRWASKRWPIDRFNALTERLLQEGVDRIVVVGGPEERTQCTPLLLLADREPRVVDLVGKTSVGTLLAVVERAGVVVANDSAVMHMGVGLERPLLGLFGPTRVELVGPYHRQIDVIQHVGAHDALDHKVGKHAPLMERISVDEVFEATMTRLERGR